MVSERLEPYLGVGVVTEKSAIRAPQIRTRRFSTQHVSITEEFTERMKNK